MDGGSSVFTFFSIIEKVSLGYSITSAADKGSFSFTRRLKTWHRSRMGDDRFSNLAVSVTSGDQTVSL